MGNQEEAVGIPGPGSFFRGLPWIIAMFPLSILSFLLWERLFSLWMPVNYAQMSSVGMGTLGAMFISWLPSFNYWPFGGIQNNAVRGTLATLFGLFLCVVFWWLLGGFFKVDLAKWAFPIIATAWFFEAATRFVGGGSHLPGIPEPRFSVLNITIVVGFTVLALVTVYWVPPFWFQYVQTLMVTGGLAYMLRRVKQPGFSFIGWTIIAIQTWVTIKIAGWLGLWSFPEVGAGWLWNIGMPSLDYQVFFGFACGLNFTVLFMTQCWPYCRIRMPWGYWIALSAVLAWSIIISAIAISIFKGLYPPETASWQCSILSWQTVLWGWVGVYSFGIGAGPYLWKGQKTPGAWDDVD